MIVVGGLGVTLLNGTAIFMSQLKTLAYGQFSIYDLSVVPMFILMGALATRAGLSQDMFRAANAWLGWLRGGTAMAAIAACRTEARRVGQECVSPCGCRWRPYL